MQIDFYKYQGTGNDFVLLDNRDGRYRLTTGQVAFLCDRRLGIGADGLMLLEQAGGYDFRMVYYNSDGRESTMCGNGGRCIVSFARMLGLIGDHCRFVAIDGPHEATMLNNVVSLHMQDVAQIVFHDDYAVLNTGSPHYVRQVSDIAATDVFGKGRRVRNLPEFGPGGTNVNFIQWKGDTLWVRTYERGVEDETLSCGTGAAAAAIAATGTATGSFKTNIQTPGGHLHVHFTKPTATSATGVVLTGPATFVFKGQVAL